MAADGTMEGQNDLGILSVGEWSVKGSESTLTMKWDSYWDDWTSRAYEVDGEIQFFDSTTLKWRTSMRIVSDGKVSISV